MTPELLVKKVCKANKGYHGYVSVALSVVGLLAG